MIVTAYGRNCGRDVLHLNLEVSDEHADALNDLAEHLSAATTEPLDKVVFIWHVPVMQEPPLMDVLQMETRDDNHDAGR